MASYEPQSSSASSSTKTPINLLRGWPHPSLLPTTLIRSAAQEALSDPSTSTPGLLYGPDPGYEPLRESIAKWLTDFFHPHLKTDSQDEGKEKGVAGSADRIAITGGASQNLGSILNVYTDSSYTRSVWVIAPAYFLAFRIFEDAGLEMRAVPEEDEGVDIGYLKTEMEKVERQASKGDVSTPAFKGSKSRPWAKVYRHIIYCVPTFANPSSRTMTLQRRKDLVALAREFDALVVCDDVYDLLQWPTDPSASRLETQRTAHLPRLVDVDRKLSGHSGDGFGNVCSNGSFSKLAGPGLRVGWCEGTTKFAHGISQVGTTKSGGAPSQLTSTYINVLLEKGELQAHIRNVLLPAYSRRYAKLVGAIQKELVPLGFVLPEHNAAMKDVQGGYFTWLTLPSSLPSTSKHHSSAAEGLAERCLAEENVTIAPGKIFEVPNDNGKVSFGNSIRLCWSWEDEDKLEEGIVRIARVAKAMIAKSHTETEEDEEKRGSGIRKGYILVEKAKG